MAPSTLHRQVEETFNNGDVDTLVRLYAHDTRLVREDRTVAIGTEQIRDVWAGFVALDGHISMTTRYAIEAEDTALLSKHLDLRRRWRLVLVHQRRDRETTSRRHLALPDRQPIRRRAHNLGVIGRVRGPSTRQLCSRPEHAAHATEAPRTRRPESRAARPAFAPLVAQFSAAVLIRWRVVAMPVVRSRVRSSTCSIRPMNHRITKEMGRVIS